jgi:peptidoglycan hydrolase-like protein with peptidoglycan-binding domain
MTAMSFPSTVPSGITPRPRMLAFGAVHPAVGELQLKLNQVHHQEMLVGRPGLPFAPLNPDAHFGSRTRAAVVAFQRLAFTDPREHDGVVGRKTWSELDTRTADPSAVTFPALPVSPPPMVRLPPEVQVNPPEPTSVGTAPARDIAEVRRQAKQLLEAYVSTDAGEKDGEHFLQIAKGYQNRGTSCGYLPHWLLWRLGCSSWIEVCTKNCRPPVSGKPTYRTVKFPNRDEGPDYLYQHGRLLERIWNFGKHPFSSALGPTGMVGRMPQQGDIVFVGNDKDYNSEHVFVFLEKIEQGDQTFWRSADAGQSNSRQQQCARFVTRQFDLVGTKGFLTDKKGIRRRVIGWLPLEHLNFADPIPQESLMPEVYGPISQESVGFQNPEVSSEQDAPTPVVHTTDLSDAFFIGLQAVGVSLRVNPMRLLEIMKAESDIRASAHNPNGNASGLIQFMPATLRGLGWMAGHEAFRRLLAHEQLPFVERFYRPYAAQGLDSTARLYQATFLPATLRLGSDPNTILCGRDGPYANAYNQNMALDHHTPKTGVIRVSDLTDYVARSNRGQRWEEARMRLEASMQLPGSEPTPVPQIPAPQIPEPTPQIPVPTPIQPSLPNLAPAAKPTLRLGSQGAAVLEAQQRLNTVHAQERNNGRTGLTAAPLRVDGMFGPQTQRAVISFQRLVFPNQPNQHDGVIGRRTHAALETFGSTVGAVEPPIPTPPSGEPATPVSNLGNWLTFKADVVRIALEEHARWHPNGGVRTETHPSMRSTLRGYWVDGSGIPAGMADTVIDTQRPWSAAFISWVMRRAGAGNLFRYATGHTVYCAAAKRNRIQQDLGNPFWLYRIGEYPPAVGDLVCTGRQQSGVSFDNVDDGQFRASHCDIVVAVGDQTITVIGGNVGNSVGQKTLRTDSRGFLLTDNRQSQYYAVLRIRTDLQQP